jgi:hypothetical protein
MCDDNLGALDGYTQAYIYHVLKNTWLYGLNDPIDTKKNKLSGRDFMNTMIKLKQPLKYNGHGCISLL